MHLMVEESQLKEATNIIMTNTTTATNLKLLPSVVQKQQRNDLHRPRVFTWDKKHIEKSLHAHPIKISSFCSDNVAVDNNDDVTQDNKRMVIQTPIIKEERGVVLRVDTSCELPLNRKFFDEKHMCSMKCIKLLLPVPPLPVLPLSVIPKTDSTAVASYQQTQKIYNRHLSDLKHTYLQYQHKKRKFFQIQPYFRSKKKMDTGDIDHEKHYCTMNHLSSPSNATTTATSVSVVCMQ
jgi:hypothetical protein